MRILCIAYEHVDSINTLSFDPVSRSPTNAGQDTKSLADDHHLAVVCAHSLRMDIRFPMALDARGASRGTGSLVFRADAQSDEHLHCDATERAAIALEQLQERPGTHSRIAGQTEQRWW